MTTHYLAIAPDGLYIETQSLHQEGRYNWAVVYVDAEGNTSRIQWPRPSSGSAVPTPRKSRPTTPQGPLMAVSAPNTGLPHILGYCKIGAYTGGMPLRVFEEAGAAALGRHGADSTRDGCPPWLFRVLGIIQERGYILKNEPIAAIEPMVCKINREADMRCLQAFLQSTQYKMYITTVSIMIEYSPVHGCM
ncbi:hypothetical protein BV25DRAFT_1917643 [Artomyces pyxidatus]|uniref:Uncharacterized protein n=1 Tax=Artomyces pyxidatus TaxID=48021 RepID=A0ACB8SX83_9AGAM|nr:hypothetical protein BV25DRAFT_1917643 [Artomyces pyxidatus]